MGLWSSAEFRRVSIQTQLSERTLAACRDVLVEGVRGSVAAVEHKMFHAQITRSVTALKEKQLSMQEGIKHLSSGALLVLKSTVLDVVKQLIGPKFAVEDAVPGGVYEGPILVNTHGFVVQKVGRNGVLHNLSALQASPALNKNLSISYAVGDGKVAIVSDISTDKAASVGLDR